MYVKLCNLGALALARVLDLRARLESSIVRDDGRLYSQIRVREARIGESVAEREQRSAALVKISRVPAIGSTGAASAVVIVIGGNLPYRPRPAQRKAAAGGGIS